MSVCVILYASVITQDGRSALMMAAREGRNNAVVELVKAGANVNLQNKVCHTFIMLLLIHITVTEHTITIETMCLYCAHC